MNRIWSLIRKYWFLLIAFLLLLNLALTMVKNIRHPNYSAYSFISEASTGFRSQRLQSKTREAGSKAADAPFQKYGILFLASPTNSIFSISTPDSIFTRVHPRFEAIYDSLALNPRFRMRFDHFRFGELSDSEFDRLISYLQNPMHRFDFWSREHREARKIYSRYFDQWDKPPLQVEIIHNASPDSNLVLTYAPHSFADQINLHGVASGTFPVKGMIASQTQSMFRNLLSLFAIFAIVYALLYRGYTIASKPKILEMAFVLMLLFPMNLLAKNLFWFNLLNGLSTKYLLLFACSLVFNMPQPLSQKRWWTYLFIALMVLNFWCYSHLEILLSLLIIAIFGLFLIQLFRQKGLMRKVMGRWFTLGFMPILLWIAGISGFVVFGELALRPLLSIVGLSLSYFYHQGPIHSLALDVALMVVLYSTIFVITLSPLMGLVLGMLQIPIRFYYRLRKWLSAFTVFGAFVSVVVFAIYFENHLLTRNIFVLFFLGCFGVLISWLAMRFFRFLDPVRHNERKALKTLLEMSFAYPEEDTYFAFYRDFLKKLYPKTQVALVTAVNKYGTESIVLPTSEMLDIVPKEAYFNLDLARIDKDPISNSFPEWIPPKKIRRKDKQANPSENNKQQEVRLFFPLGNAQNKHTGFLYLGESGKLYWDKENADFIAQTVQIFNSFLININLNTSYREEQLAREREKQERIFNEQLAQERELRNQELQEFNRKIMDSINYASLIQKSILPSEHLLNGHLDDYFVIWRPRDVVGGDYYWFYPIPESNKYLLAVIDCTGHGVPGAFMTLMSNSILNSIVKDRKLHEPHAIISQLHTEVRYTLQQAQSESMKDGLDISLILVDKDRQLLHFSGAKHKALLISNSEGNRQTKILIGHKYSIGGIREQLLPETEICSYSAGDTIYLLSDGLVDQPVQQSEGLKRMLFENWVKRFAALSNKDMPSQKTELNEFIDLQLAYSEQRDDIIVMGVRL